MDTLSTLESNKRYYENMIYSKQNHVNRLVDARDSLERFRNQVLSSQSEFYSINNGKSRYLNPVKNIQKNCKTAKTYHAGMSNVLNGIGTNIIGMVFRWLISAVNRRLAQYNNDINSCRNEINRFKKNVNNITKDIQIEREKNQ